MAESCSVLPVVGRDADGNPVSFARPFRPLALQFGRKIAYVIWGYINTDTFQRKHRDFDPFTASYEETVRAIKNDSAFLNSEPGEIVKDALHLMQVNSKGEPKAYNDLSTMSIKIKDYNDKYKELFSIAVVEKELDSKTGKTHYKIRVTDRNSKTEQEASFFESRIKLLDNLLNLLKSKGININLNDKCILNCGFYDAVYGYEVELIFKQIFAKDSPHNEESIRQKIDSLEEKEISLIVNALYGNQLLELIKENLTPDMVDYLSTLLKEDIDKVTENFSEVEKNEYILTKYFYYLNEYNPDQHRDDKDIFRQLIGIFKNKFDVERSDFDAIEKDAEKVILKKSVLKKISELNVLNTKEENLTYIINQMLIMINKRIKSGNILGYQFDREAFEIYQQASSQRKELQLEDAFESCIYEVYISLKKDEERLSLILNEADATTSEYNIEQAAMLYRRVSEMIAKYKDYIADLKEYTKKNYFTDDVEMRDKFIEILNTVGEQISNLDKRTRDLRLQICYYFLKLYYDEEQYITGKDGTPPDIKSLLEQIDYDATPFFETWVGALTDSSDLISSIIAKIVKEKANKRDDLIMNDEKKLDRLIENLRASGIDNTDWMCEKDAQGNLTGNFIGEYDMVRFNEDREKAFKEIDNNPNLSVALKYNTKYRWDKEHMRDMYVHFDKDGNLESDFAKHHNWKSIKVPSSDYYRSDWNTIRASWNKALKDYFRAIMEMKARYELLVPKLQRNLYRMPQVSKSAGQVFREKGLSAFKEYVKNDINTRLFRTAESINFKYNLLDEPIDTIPVSFAHKLDPKIISTDINSIMHVFMASSYHFSTLHECINSLMVVKEQLKDRKVFKTKSKTENEDGISSPNFEHGGSYYKRLQTFFDYYIFGSKRSDTYLHTSFKDPKKEYVSVDGLTKTVTGYASKVAIGLSPATAVANLIAGKYQMFIEAVSGENFSWKELLRSWGVYFKNIFGMLSESGKRKTNKMGVLFNYFDMMDEFYEQNLKKTYDSTALKNLWRNTNGFVMQKMGEHILHARTGMCILMKRQVLKNGTKMSLWDALEVDKDGNVSIEGITTLNGTKIDLQYIHNIKNLINLCNRKLHGAFNKFDKGACHDTVFGQLIMTFRQWMPAVYGHRFDFKGKYMLDIDDETGELKTEKVYGYYIQTYRAIKNITKELRAGKALFTAIHSTLTERDKAAMRKAFTEIGMCFLIKVILTGLTMLAVGADDDDDDSIYNRPVFRFFYDLLLRLNTEIDAYGNPFGFFEASKQLVSDPIVSVRQMDNIISIGDLSRWVDTVDRGFWEGTPVAVKNSLMAIPYVSGMIRLFKRTYTKPKYYSLISLDDDEGDE